MDGGAPDLFVHRNEITDRQALVEGDEVRFDEGFNAGSTLPLTPPLNPPWARKTRWGLTPLSFGRRVAPAGPPRFPPGRPVGRRDLAWVAPMPNPGAQKRRAALLSRAQGRP